VHLFVMRRFARHLRAFGPTPVAASLPASS
jgi:hypothetical protein